MLENLSAVGEFPLLKAKSSTTLFYYRLLRALATKQMDFWATLLLFAFMAGIMGWTMTPFINAILWYCDWQDGTDINWGLDTAFSVAVPFAWMFAIFEIILLYCQ